MFRDSRGTSRTPNQHGYSQGAAASLCVAGLLLKPRLRGRGTLAIAPSADNGSGDCVETRCPSSESDSMKQPYAATASSSPVCVAMRTERNVMSIQASGWEALCPRTPTCSHNRRNILTNMGIFASAGVVISVRSSTQLAGAWLQRTACASRCKVSKVTLCPFWSCAFPRAGRVISDRPTRPGSPAAVALGAGVTMSAQAAIACGLSARPTAPLSTPSHTSFF